MNIQIKILVLLGVCAILMAPQSYGQDGSALPTPKEEDKDAGVRFNGLGRTILRNTEIDGPVLEADPETIRRQVDGEFLLDLQINAQPNDKTEVQSILRLRNEFGGFFGAGMSVEVRELWARGIIGNAIKYHVGDMDIAMTPYTFYNFEEEGFVNNPAALEAQREVIYYEQFYGNGNTRRVQGTKLDFGLNFTHVLRDADFSAFIARVRGTDFFTIPSRYTSGGHMKFRTRNISDSLGMRADFGFNFVHTFDDLRSGEANTGIRNSIATFNWDFRLYQDRNTTVSLLGETGRSSLTETHDTLRTALFSIDDYFMDAGFKVAFREQKITVQGSYVDIGPDFFSIAAQSRRIDLQNERSFYDRLGPDQQRRRMSIFDLNRDNLMYTFELSDRLMPYDPRFSNTMPYGLATPNRRGARFGAEYGGSEDLVEARLDAAFMSEILGQGTEELKNFTLLRAAANLNAHQLLDFENKLRFTFGYQFENTQRGGVPVEQIDLMSNMVELGVEIELFKGFEVLVGGKYLQAEGNEYVPQIDRFNVVRNFPEGYEADDREQLLAVGLKYNFNPRAYLTMQYHNFQSRRGENNPIDYNLDQIFVIYNMLF